MLAPTMGFLLVVKDFNILSASPLRSETSSTKGPFFLSLSMFRTKSPSFAPAFSAMPPGLISVTLIRYMSPSVAPRPPPMKRSSPMGSLYVMVYFPSSSPAPRAGSAPRTAAAAAAAAGSCNSMRRDEGFEAVLLSPAAACPWADGKAANALEATADAAARAAAAATTAASSARNGRHTVAPPRPPRSGARPRAGGVIGEAIGRGPDRQR
mmetsp:Transcript_84080/g.218896  ORF Transcript_84080/g.218896 Transcript_84080/m.218896 type:complete len:210 (+) Transcript_84080:891-1520(+)